MPFHVLAENQRQRAHKLAKIKQDAEELAAKMEGLNLTIGAKASSTGKIFGSVNTIQISEALKAAGIASSRISTEFYGTEKDSSFTPENNRLAVCIVK